MITIAQFHLEVARAMAMNPQWRYGQAVFNVMYDLYPELADAYRSTAIDPFYRNAVAGAFITACLGEER